MRTPIDDQLDTMDSEFTGAQMSKKLNPNSIQARILRRDTRYKLYTIRTCVGKALPITESAEFLQNFQTQLGFDGWDKFAITWDVSLNDPFKVVSRKFSEIEEWENTVKAKFPQIQPDGSVKYPDLNVKKSVDKEAKKQTKNTPKSKKFFGRKKDK